jgi:hypothetical protein
MEVTPLIDHIAWNTAEHVQGSKGKHLPTPLVCLAKMERSLDCNEIGRRCLSGRPKEKYPRKQPL